MNQQLNGKIIQHASGTTSLPHTPLWTKEQPNHHWLSVHLKISRYFTLLLAVNPKLNPKGFKFCHKILVHPLKSLLLFYGDKTSSFIQWARAVQNIPQPRHVITNWPTRHTGAGQLRRPHSSLFRVSEPQSQDPDLQSSYSSEGTLDKLSLITSRRSSPSTGQKDSTGSLSMLDASHTVHSSSHSAVESASTWARSAGEDRATSSSSTYSLVKSSL